MTEIYQNLVGLLYRVHVRAVQELGLVNEADVGQLAGVQLQPTDLYTDNTETRKYNKSVHFMNIQ